MARTLRGSLRLEGSRVITGKTKGWEQEFDKLPQAQKDKLLKRGIVIDDEAEDDTDVSSLSGDALKEYLDGIFDVRQVRRLSRADNRSEARSAYEARINELRSGAIPATPATPATPAVPGAAAATPATPATPAVPAAGGQ